MAELIARLKDNWLVWVRKQFRDICEELVFCSYQMELFPNHHNSLDGLWSFCELNCPRYYRCEHIADIDRFIASVENHRFFDDRLFTYQFPYLLDGEAWEQLRTKTPKEQDQIKLERLYGRESHE